MVLLRNQLMAEEIAGGHAFDKHVIQQAEFPGITVVALHVLPLFGPSNPQVSALIGAA
jgi:hypothetical protein